MKKFLAIVMVSLMLIASVCSVVADEFTPSVTAKDAPEVKESVVVTTTGEEVDVVVEVVSYATREEVPEVKEVLDKAYNDLATGTAQAEVKKVLNEIAKEIDPSYTAENFVVSDLFYMEVDDSTKELLADGNKLEVVFAMNIGPNDTCPVVMYACNGDDWAVVDPADVTNNGDGTITVKFSTLCPIAMMSATETPTTPVNPGQTSTSPIAIIVMIVVAVCVGAAAAVLVVLIKKAKSSKAA